MNLCRFSRGYRRTSEAARRAPSNVLAHRSRCVSPPLLQVASKLKFKHFKCGNSIQRFRTRLVSNVERKTQSVRKAFAMRASSAAQSTSGKFREPRRNKRFVKSVSCWPVQYEGFVGPNERLSFARAVSSTNQK